MDAGTKKASMTKKWIAINLLLLAIAVLLGWQLRAAIIQYRAHNNTAKIQPALDLKKRMLPEKQAAKAVSTTIYSPADFSIIADKNLFSDSRSKEEKVENLAPPEPPPLAVKPILVGITITDRERKASIIEPGGMPGRGDDRGRRAQFKRIGDVYQGYTITEIQSDRIVLTSGTRREVIPLREGSKKASGGKTAILSTRVVPIGPGGITGGAPVSISGANVGALSKAPAAGASPPAAQTPTTTRIGATVQPTPPTQPTTTPAAGSGGTTPSRIIRTPFGDIVRPER
jgi:hypothetical protein